jgi:glucuronate isomerase
MENNHRTALKSFGKGQGKDTNFQAQMKRVLNRLFNRCVQHTLLLPIFGSVRTDIVGTGDQQK